MTALRADTTELMRSYLQWLRDNTVLTQVDDTWGKMSTPFLDRHNDCLEVYVRHEDDQIILTDDSYILDDLKMSGFNLDTTRRQGLLQTILNGFGVERENDQLIVRTDKRNFGQKKNDLLQAMLAVDDLYQSSAARVRNLFIEDVTGWLDEIEVRATPDVHFKGKSGFNHTFNFAIPKSKQAPERILHAVNNITKQSAENLMFRWMDVAPTRKPGSRLVLMLNDIEHTPRPDVLDALHHHDISAVLWSKREEAADTLAA